MLAKIVRCKLVDVAVREISIKCPRCEYLHVDTFDDGGLEQGVMLIVRCPKHGEFKARYERGGADADVSPRC